MTTITETINKKLLDSAGNPGVLESVLHDYAHSKGPLYIALGQATCVMTERLKALAEKCTQAEKERQHLEQQVEAAAQHLAELDVGLKTGAKQLVSLEEKLKDKQAILEEAKALAGLGFGVEELSQLRKMLDQTAVVQGVKANEATKLFFERVDQYQNMVAMEAETVGSKVTAAKAKAEAEQWQAQAKAVEAKAKARKVAIDFTEKIMAQGLKEGDLPQWARILSGASVAPENLASALEQFGSLEKLYKDRRQQVKKLDGQVKQLSSQVKALTEERENASAAIGAVKEKALANIEATSKKAVDNIQKLVDKAGEYGELERQAGILEQEIALARAFRTGEPEQWHQVPRRTAQELLAGLVLWSRGNASHNPALLPPQKPLSSHINMYPWERANLAEVLVWALTGISVEEPK